VHDNRSEPDSSDVAAAATRIQGCVVRTPVVRSEEIDQRAGAQLFLKAENLQLGGSYKARGAMHAVGRLTDDQRARGVVAQSTGNHAIAIAIAAQRHGVRATVVLPESAPPMKAAQARAAGAEVVLAGTTIAERHAKVADLVASTGATAIDAYDHTDVVTGQGTATLELVEQVEAETGASLDAVILPVGGGGGVAGACLAVAHRGIAVWGVEPVGCDSLRQSLAAGERVSVAPGPTLADGLTPAQVGALPFQIATRSLAGCVNVDDPAIEEAMALLLFHSKLLVEPSGAAGLAAVLDGGLSGAPRRIGVVLTGGNVEPSLVAQLAARCADGQPPQKAAQ